MIVTKRGIKCVAYVHTAEGLVDVDELNEQQKKKLANKIITTWMNELYRGKAVFTEPEEDDA